MTTDILVIGGGAAGILSALYAARAGARVTLLERNEKLGKKLYITGKGRCNLTNTAEREQFLANVVRNPRFLYAALRALDNRGVMDLVESLGVPLKVERGGRVFPQSDRSSDITRALERELMRLGVEVRLGARVRRLAVREGRACGAELENGRLIEARRVIVACGGASYPATGSTGDGYRLAAEVGHTIEPIRGALTPIETMEAWPAELMGLSLKNVVLRAETGKKKLFEEQGEMLFTHFGISGPLALSLSSYLPETMQGVSLQIDLKPALDEKMLDLRLLRDFDAMRNKQLSSVLDGLAPHALALQLAREARLSPTQSVHSVTHVQRRALVDVLKKLPLTVRGLRGLDEAIITRGGVCVKEVNPSTLESRKLQGLHFAGEVLDVDALTGGYNLQIAFSTGALAGISAVEALVHPA